jgi:predicted transcriptional regulator
MLTIKDLLSRKGNKTISIHPDTTVYEALRLMAINDIGALLVVEDEILVGIFSERDYARKGTLNNRSERISNSGKYSTSKKLPPKIKPSASPVLSEDQLEHICGTFIADHKNMNLQK